MTRRYLRLLLTHFLGATLLRVDPGLMAAFRRGASLADEPDDLA